MEEDLKKHSGVAFGSSRACDFQNLTLTSWSVLGSLTEEEGKPAGGREAMAKGQGFQMPAIS